MEQPFRVIRITFTIISLLKGSAGGYPSEINVNKKTNGQSQGIGLGVLKFVNCRGKRIKPDFSFPFIGLPLPGSSHK
jgi:hypothetical protein